MWNLKEKLTKLGDLNGDGKIDTEDLVYLKEKGKEKLHQIEEKATSVVNGAMKSKTLKSSVQGAAIGTILPVGGPEIGAVVGATIGYFKSKKDAEDIAARRTATRRANAEAAEEKAAGTPARSVAEKVSKPTTAKSTRTTRTTTRTAKAAPKQTAESK